MDEKQADFFAKEPPGQPEGLRYRAAFVDPEEQAELLCRLQDLDFAPFQFQGFLGKRETISFGMTYRFDGSGLAAADPIPDWLEPFRQRAAEFADLQADELGHALLIRYGQGAGLGWHRDRPVFGDVIGISLLAEAPLRFRRPLGKSKWQRFTLRLAPGSIYLLRGESRDIWEHSLAPVEEPRYSITFRSLRAGSAPNTQL